MILTVEGYRKKSSCYGLRKPGIFKLKHCFCHGIAYCYFRTEEFLFWLHPKSLNPTVLFAGFCCFGGGGFFVRFLYFLEGDGWEITSITLTGNAFPGYWSL